MCLVAMKFSTISLTLTWEYSQVKETEFLSAEHFNGTSSSVAKHVLKECQEYKEERKNFESEMIKCCMYVCMYRLQRVVVDGHV